MNNEINYPYGIPFFTDQIVIPVTFINNEDHFINIYFIKKNKLENLAGIIFSKEKKKFHFPKNTIVAIITQKNKDKIQCFIKLKQNMIYIYP